MKIMKGMKNSKWKIFMIFRSFMVFMFLGVLPSLSAQTATGEISGKVADKNGWAMPGVSVTLTGEALSAPRKTTSDQLGAYRFAETPPGTYTVSFALQGFFPLKGEGLTVRAGARVALDVQMAVGPPGQAIDVHEGPGFMVDTRSVQKGEVLVRLETAHGEITLAVDTVHAPITAANFLKYVDGGFYNGGRFYRVTRPDNYTPTPPNRPAMALIQGGIDPARNKEKVPAIPLERTSVTGLTHVVGVLSMARGNTADSGTSEFFILLDDQPSLDFGGRRFDDGQGAAAFGRVVSGLDVVRKIQQLGPLQEQNRQNLVTPVTIGKAARVAK